MLFSKKGNYRFGFLICLMEEVDQMTERESLYYKMVGQRLRDTRRLLGISQERHAEKINVKSNTIHRYETAEQRMNLMTADDLAGALGISLNDLIPDAVCYDIDQSAIEQEAIYRYHRLSVDNQLFVLKIILTISD